MNSLNRYAEFVAKGIRAAVHFGGMKVVQNVLVGVSLITVIVACGRSINSVPLHNDEISWFFHTQFFEQVFIKHDVTSPFWYSYESYDHPHFSKYIFGAYMRFKNPSVFSARDHLEKTYGRWSFYFNPDMPHIRSTVFAPYLYVMREVSAVFFIGSCLLIGILLFFLTDSIALSFVGPVIFSFNPYFMSVMIRATSDAQITFFMLASLVFYMLYRRKNAIRWLVLASICVGLSVSAKLTGVLGLYACIVTELTWWGMGRIRLGNMIKTLCILVFISAGIWFVLNPTLYTQPIAGTLYYFDFRYAQSERLQYAFPGVSLHTIPDRIHAVYCTLFEGCGGDFFQGALLPGALLNMLAVALGVIYLYVRMRRQNSKHTVLSFWIYTAIVGIVSTMMLFINSDRYYTPIQIPVWMMEFMGIYGLLMFLCKRMKKMSV